MSTNRIRQAVSRRLHSPSADSAGLPSHAHVAGRRVRLVPIDDVHAVVDVSPGDTVQVSAEVAATSDERGAALLELRALDAAGERVALAAWPHRSARVGEYQYLLAGDPNSPHVNELTVTVPEGVERLELIGHRWKRLVSTGIVGGLVVNRLGDPDAQRTLPSGLPLQVSAKHVRVVASIDPGTNSVRIELTHLAGEVDSSGPMRITFLDARGDMVLPVTDVQQHPKLGPLLTISGPAGEQRRSSWEIDVPAGARSLELAGLDWGKKTATIVGPVEVEPLWRASDAIETFLGEVPADAPLFIIDTTAPPLGHETLSLRPNNLTAAYARLGIWVVFLPFGSLQDFPARHSSRVLQVPRTDVDRLVTALADHRAPERSLYLCSSFPSLHAVTTATRLKMLGWRIAYEARDDMEEFNRVGYSKWYAPALEREMLRIADRVVSVSTALDNKLVSMYPPLAEHTVIPNAVNASVIENGRQLRTAVAAERRRERPVVGYVGHLTPSWFDWPLLIAGAEWLPDVTFEIVGHGMPEGLSLPANVRVLGAKSHDELLPIVATWTVGLIPFADLPLTRSVDPNKIYEYFAWGLRCVTAPMGKVHEYPSTFVYRGVDEFVEQLRAALAEPMGPDERAALERFLETADWDSRARELCTYLEMTPTGPEGDDRA